MSRYIKFDDAVKVMACEMYAEAQSQGYDVDSVENFMPEAKAWLNDAPSIDIVRCKECRYWKGDGVFTINALGEEEQLCKWWSKFGTIRTAETGFCYYGERESE